jgi:hypothetical protein
VNAGTRASAEASQRRREAFAEDYLWLRAQGVTNAAIADRFGIDRASLLRQLSRLGVEYVPEQDERRALDALDRAIASGRRFSANDLPFTAECHWAISAAAKAGRIVRVGTAAGLLTRQPVGVYVATTAQAVAS